MGYDMRWRKVDPDETVAYQAAHARFNELVAVRNALPKEERGTFNRVRGDEIGWDNEDAYDGQSARYRVAADAVHAAYDEMNDIRKSYYRLSITGMGMCRRLMYEVGMIFDDEPHPDWPEYEAYGVTDEQVDAVRYPEYAGDTVLDDDLIMRVARYEAASDHVLSYHGKEVPGIPAHKFGSNDGWIVTPVECESALRIAAAKLDEIGEDALGNLIENHFYRDMWATWLQYLRGAITHDGFEVH
jgi:hypothetical protein